jgi:hypothetical protein
MGKLVDKAIRFLVIMALVILVVSLAVGVIQGHVHK